MHTDETVGAFVRSLQVGREVPDFRATPATWKEEGDLTLRPSEKMVGKVRQYLERQRGGSDD